MAHLVCFFSAQKMFLYVSFSSGGVFEQTRALNYRTQSQLSKKTGGIKKYVFLKKFWMKTWHIGKSKNFRRFSGFLICECHVLVHNFFKNKYFLIPPVFFESYSWVLPFRALVCSKSPPDEKDATYFLRTIFENFTFWRIWGLAPPHKWFDCCVPCLL